MGVAQIGVPIASVRTGPILLRRLRDGNRFAQSRAGKDGARVTEPFHGAKTATLIGDRLLVILRDDTPGLIYPAHWDFPGGGREEGETGFETAAREMREEVGLDLSRAAILWQARFPSADVPGQHSWFFVARFPKGSADDVRLGEEGQLWRLMPVDEVLGRGDVVPYLAQRLRLWVETGAEPG